MPATLADRALDPYTSYVPEDGIALEPSPRAGAWRARVEVLPGLLGTRRMS